MGATKPTTTKLSTHSVGEKKKAGEKKRVTRPNFVVVELIFGSHVNMLVAFEWVIHINYSHHYATGEKGGTKRERERKKFLRFRLASAAATRR